MEPIKFVGIDETQYRNEVLLLSSEESEVSLEQKLADEAHQLGLNIPELEITASLATSIASGMVDLSSPVLSSDSSTDRNSLYEVRQSQETPPLDQVISSLSELTFSSDHVKGGSTRSIASLSSRPTSYSSSEGKLAHGPDNIPIRLPYHRNSLLSVSSADKKEKRRSSLKLAIGRIQFRKKRSPSTVLLPPAAQITVAKDEGGVEKVYVEAKVNVSHNPSSNEDDKVLKLEVPFYDNETLQRSHENEELIRLRESHKLERNRHVAFQAAFLTRLRRDQQAAVADTLMNNKTLEDQKRERNIADAIRMEERQLSIELDQLREFEREKQNSRTRIKYMEGYFTNVSPPPTPRLGPIPESDINASTRIVTDQQKAQLAQEHRDHECMDQLHQARIKVLRDRQELKLQETIQRMERELEELIGKHASEFTELERQHQQAEMLAIQAFDAKKTKLRHRWNLEETILRKRLEVRYGKPYGPLPPLSFTDSDSHDETRDSAICVSENT